jgi:hypothetical protein
MPKQTRRYEGPDADTHAIADLRDWLTDRQWNIIEGAARDATDVAHIRDICMALDLCGVSGYPFHAFCRTHCPEAYALWLNQDQEN